MAFGDHKSGSPLTGGNNSIPASFATSAGSIAVVAGDLGFCVVGQQTNLTVTAVADNLGNSWTAVDAGADAGNATGRAFYFRFTGSGTLTTVTATCTASANDGSIVACVFSGPFVTSPLDKAPTVVQNDVSTPYTGPASGTLSQADEYVIAYYAKDGNSALTGSSPNTLRGNQNQSANIATGIGGYVVSATTTQSPAWTGTAPTVDVLGTVTFKKDLLQALTQASTYAPGATFNTHTLTPGAIALTQSAIAAFSPTFNTHTLSSPITLTQGSRFDSSPTFNAHALSVGPVTLTAAHFTVQNSFPTHVLTATIALTQDVRFDSSTSFFAHVVTGGGAGGGSTFQSPKFIAEVGRGMQTG